MLPFKLRYGLTMPLIIGGFGAIQLVLALTRISRGDYLPSVIVGVIALLMAAGLNYTPYFVVDSQSLTLYGLYGLLKRTYAFRSLADVKIEHNRVAYRDSHGNWTILPISRQIAKAEDWSELERMLSVKR